MSEQYTSHVADVRGNFISIYLVRKNQLCEASSNHLGDVRNCGLCFMPWVITFPFIEHQVKMHI